ncbi:RbsD/FucU family protein [Pseudoroseicyclus aestuarii]|uniref:L-fucose mutarotase n=1 Tax=Pseudoroseicyclus aestuarii TaxID=1795041 RepID=A0A318ST10_9RHOB|nr:RbsD/FucU domain-containing protein [Pseudoroseicyclus aestuarii]PYE82442.1 L-fucose mutarotase [Pseudoroseicyclus aestuarii]
MLFNIPPILSPDLLWTLQAMGHGDEIVIADANFPGTSMGARCHRLDGISATDALDAVLQLLPLDSFVETPATTMQVVGDASAKPEAVAEFRRIITDRTGAEAKMGTLERFEFYERAKKAFAIVQTGESRIYANVILTKGVIA